jgi:4-hydroxybenzoate polyprenyltransferase
MSEADAMKKPLCVDLDGTLLRSDLLVESALELLAAKPWLSLLMPWWLIRGKANLKREIASRTQMDVGALPYDQRLLEILREQPDRHRVLCTASDSKLAAKVADHLGCFDEVIASDGHLNLSGSRKADALAYRFGERGFDYAGNSRVDLPVWARARGAIVVNGSVALARLAQARCELLLHLTAEPTGPRTWIRALRLHQWLKNLLVFLPLLASHQFLEPQKLLLTFQAFIAFGLCASGVYLLNDLLDLRSDRAHPRKKSRPFASGQISLVSGLLMAPVLTAGGLALAWLVAPLFGVVLGCYYLLTVAYSIRLKRVPMLDVMVLAALYTVRIVGGAAAIGAPLSFWLLAFSMFIFLSLALLKRYTELAAMAEQGRGGAAGRGYAVDDLPLLQSLGSSAGYLSALVLALYINSSESVSLYERPEILWLLCPLVLYWVSRAWLISHRGDMHDDPVVFATMDRTSQIVAGLSVGIIAAAT